MIEELLVLRKLAKNFDDELSEFVTEQGNDELDAWFLESHASLTEWDQMK
jgi:hypothetical protein